MAANTWIGNYYVDASGAWIPNRMKEGWQSISGRWKYVNADGEYVKSKWHLVKDKWYHFDANGWMQTGWLSLNNTWYYLEASGAMVSQNWCRIKNVWYYFEASGRMKTGWLLLKDTWYYLQSSGAMVSGGWRWINNKCYYFAADGSMAADTWIGDYYVNEDGAWVPNKQKVKTGWEKISGRWKYKKADGEYAKAEWQQINNKKYYFDADGWMQTGWVSLDGSWYYFDTDGAWDPEKEKLTDIMGESSVSAAQLARFYKGMNKQYPSYYTQNDEEAKTIEDFCQIYIEECKAEGVKAEVAFVQAMVETGYLTFGGDVDISQYNFAGMGATGNGVKGNSFSTVRIGIRAQVQHLKCYASSDPLNGERVDPRWGEWLRGKAPYVE